MRRLILCAFLAVMAVIAQAQNFRTMFSEPSERVTAEIVAGANISDFLVEPTDIVSLIMEPKFRQHPGFNIGVNVDVPIFEGFYLKPGVLFTTRGGDFREEQDETHYVENIHSSYYLQVPILASFRLGDIDRAQFQLNVGPYFAAGLFGDSTHTTKSGRLEQSHTIEYFHKEVKEGFYEGFAHRFDCGLSFAAAVLLIEHLYLGVQYDLGLYNVAKKPIQDNTLYKVTNGNLMVHVGYRF